MSTVPRNAPPDGSAADTSTRDRHTATDLGATRGQIEFDRVRKVYHTRTESIEAISEASFEIRPGEFVSLLGPSGCGKSTLVLLAAGLIPASAGEIRIDGQPVHGPQTQIGIVFQNPVLLDWRTAIRNVLLQIEARGLSTDHYRERALAFLRQVGLEGFEHKYPHELSGGMKQRVAIVRALIHDPAILLMDEPFGALDAMTRDQMALDLLKLWSRAQKTVLFVTHSISEAIFLSDRIVIMTPRPAKIERIFEIDLPRPRRLAIRETPAFGRYSAAIRELFTARGMFSEEDEEAGQSDGGERS